MEILKTIKGAFKSKTIWGIIIAGLGTFEVGRRVIEATGLTPETGIEFTDQALQGLGALLAVYGRIKADKPLSEK